MRKIQREQVSGMGTSVMGVCILVLSTLCFVVVLGIIVVAVKFVIG